jgi:3-hydroxyacyl-[acyl-carrier-protein] dehydratase
MDVVEIQEILPHRYPFLLVDRVISLDVGENIVSFKNVSISEPVFGGLLAFQSMGLTKEEVKNKVVYFMSIDKAKFRKPVLPGDRLEYRVSVIKRKGSIWMLDGKAYVDDVLVSEAELKAMVVDK